jgi:ketol-acid reductoisomerase
VLAEIYDEVDSGRELAGVIDAAERLTQHPMHEVAGTRMWEVGAAVRETRSARSTRIDPFAAGVFAATMTAQVDLLRKKGHPWSEVANESIIEAVDSLNPYMHFKGVAYMVDNCSTTARLGARKWGPIFEAALTRTCYPAADRGHPADDRPFEAFLTHPVHDVLAKLTTFRPTVDIAVL